MRKLILAIAAATMATGPAFAHPGGHGDEQPRRPPITQLARDAVVKLVTQKKLPASWTSATVARLDMRNKNGADQWVVTFQNPAVRQAAKRTLYVLMTRDGAFISANHRLV